MFRAPILLVLAALALSACARGEYEPYTAAEIKAMEAANAVVVQAAAVGCGQPQNVYSLGAHGWNIAEHYANTLNEHQLLDLERCMAANIAVAQAAADVGLLDAVELQSFGEYGYTTEFLAEMSDSEMVAIDRGLQEAIDSRIAATGH